MVGFSAPAAITMRIVGGIYRSSVAQDVGVAGVPTGLGRQMHQEVEGHLGGGKSQLNEHVETG
jgi:hypothetical protein